MHDTRIQNGILIILHPARLHIYKNQEWKLYTEYSRFTINDKTYKRISEKLELKIKHKETKT
uniref:Uncharacterized protein n=1 Tax=Arundo donax TaxID=35708 RepID=A0A0A8XSJ6_ARUDO